ncbi:MAG: TonB-dependent receptor, partial [Caulobacterales bacterium]|nr:TonB-dependent receptor [Caulobacterales bacterium]
RVSFSSRNQDGFQESLIDGRTYGDRNRDSARIQLSADLTDTIDVNFALDGARIREDSAPSTLVGVTIDEPGGRLVAPSISWIYNTFEAPLVDVPGFGVNVPYDERWVTGDPDLNYATGFERGTDLDIWGGALTLSWDVTPSIQLKSITSYRETEGGFSSEADGSPLTLTEADTLYFHDQFTQELQATGASFGDRLQWVVGGFFLDEEGREDEIVPIAPLSFGTVVSFQDHSTQSIAAYAQGTYRLTDTLSVTAGARYTADEKTNLPRNASLTLGFFAADFIFGTTDDDLVAGDSLPFVPNGVEVKNDFEEISPRFSVEYTPRDDLLLYGSYSQGFKSGGFNIRYLVPRGEVLGYDPETLTTFEAGLKWTGFDNRFRVNASGYTSTWEDLQVVVFEAFGAPLIQNAGEADINGFELETFAAPTDELELSFALGYLDASYNSINNPTTDIPDIQLVTVDNELPNAPEWTMNASAAYTVELPNSMGQLVPRVDVSYVSDYENDAQNSPFLSVESYEIVNLNLAYRAPDGRWSLTGFANNLTDSRYITAGNSNFSIGFHEANFNEPRTWGFRLRSDF